MKKMLGILIFGIFLVSVMGIVSADSGLTRGGAVSSSPVTAVQNVISGAYDLLEPLLVIAVGDNGNDVSTFFAKLLFLVIIFAIIWTVLNGVDFFSENRWVLWVVSIAVSVLAVKYIGGQDVVAMILLPYSSLGIALVSALPFVIYFFMVVRFRSGTVRRIFWVFFAVIFFVLWIMRLEEIGNYSWIYFLTAVLGLIVMWQDGTIRRLMNRINMERGLSNSQMERKHRLIDDLEKYRDLRVKLIERKATKSEIDDVDKHIKSLEKSIARYS